jgi:hypothetical protein
MPKRSGCRAGKSFLFSFRCTAASNVPSYSVVRPVDPMERAMAIIEARDVFQWSEFETKLRRGKEEFMGVPDKYKKMIKDSTPTFRMDVVSEADSLVMLNELRNIFMSLWAEYQNGDCAIDVICTMVRLILLRVLLVQNELIDKVRHAEPRKTLFSEIIDDGVQPRSGRMPAAVRSLVKCRTRIHR